MATKIGAVVYLDTNVVFRIVYPVEGEPDSVLDDPQWTTIGCDPSREAVLIKLDAANPDWSVFAGVEPAIAPRSFGH